MCVHVQIQRCWLDLLDVANVCTTMYVGAVRFCYTAFDVLALYILGTFLMNKAPNSF